MEAGLTITICYGQWAMGSSIYNQFKTLILLSQHHKYGILRFSGNVAAYLHPVVHDFFNSNSTDLHQCDGPVSYTHLTLPTICSV